MSKQPARSNGSATKRQAEDGDICPVCKSSRYLNPNMRFKVNPECYHKMCETCVVRIYDHGPAPCAIAGCARTLRMKDFRTQTFEDLKIEREVDIRRRVMRAMDKREDDFETLRDYNDYLEQVEEITWNLILKMDVDATESRLRRWEDHQKAELNLSTSRRDPDVSRKGGVQRKGASGAGTNLSAASSNRDGDDTGFTFHGLKKRVAPPKEAPFDPSGGWSLSPQYYVLQDSYDVSWYAQYSDTYHLAGGYAVQDFCNRTLSEAFGGLGVFIEDEIVARETPQAAAVAVGGQDTSMDDVF